MAEKRGWFRCALSVRATGFFPIFSMSFHVISTVSGAVCLPGTISTSAFKRGFVVPTAWETPEAKGYSLLKLGAEFSSLGQSLHADPEHAERLAARMDAWLDARRRHGGDLAAVSAARDELRARLAEAARGLVGERIGVMLPAGVAAPDGVAAVFAWGRWADPELMAHTLYAGLRELDLIGCTAILCPLPPSEGIGAAIRDRLGKAGNREQRTGDRE